MGIQEYRTIMYSCNTRALIAIPGDALIHSKLHLPNRRAGKPPWNEESIGC